MPQAGLLWLLLAWQRGAPSVWLGNALTHSHAAEAEGQVGSCKS